MSKHKLAMIMLSVARIVSLVLAGCVEPVTPPEEPGEPAEPELPKQLICAICTKLESSDFPPKMRIATLGDEAIPPRITIIQPGGSIAALESLLGGEADFAQALIQE